MVIKTVVISQDGVIGSGDGSGNDGFMIIKFLALFAEYCVLYTLGDSEIL